jgi:hypothetical protein
VKAVAPSVVAVLAVLGVAAADAAAAGVAHPVSGSAICAPKSSKAGIAYCGPATATLTVGGKTYDFKGGTCLNNPTAGMPLSILLGVDDYDKQSPVNGGKPLLSISVSTNTGSREMTVTADDDGKSLVTAVGGVTIKGSYPTEGTFSVKAGSQGFGTSAFQGSWNCHGPVQKV